MSVGGKSSSVFVLSQFSCFLDMPRLRVADFILLIHFSGAGGRRFRGGARASRGRWFHVDTEKKLCE